ncbi:TonB-dependent siderophore receptor [Sphingobacterium deserti]|uniref:TonB-dependent siderophore receptor n=1 Tax=Sphingobacterium deserti TaxID=1229276 RepID=A0A0B8T5F0_9SPHI|nr:TonB-dependent receptor plug domain-containing protein [Sphingobacterium deserti]KGE15748.1 TonB-dependent siderophore receptor [Sphingobacterium deserti]
MVSVEKVLASAIICLPLLLNAQESSFEIATDTLKSFKIQDVEVSSKYYKKYNPKQMSEGLRLETSLLKLPQNIQVLDGEVFRDQAISNLNESVTRNVSGTFREELHNGISPDIYSRGGYISAQRNGVDLRPLGKGPIGDDVAIIDRVEFQKGPSGFMNAMSDPSGSFNIVTKKPTGETRRQVDFLTGSFGLLRAAVDLDGQVDKANKLQYRLNVMGMKSNGFLQHDRNNRILFAPSLKYKLNDRSSITAEYIYQQLNYLLLSEAQMSPYGFGTLPRDFTITDPSIRPFVGNDHNIFLTYQNRFSDSWQLSTRLAYINSRYNGTLFWVNGTNPDNIDILDRNLVFDSSKYGVFSAQTYVNGRFKTGAILHNMVMGVDINNKSSRSLDSWGTATSVYPLSISNPIYAGTVMNNGVGGDFTSENDLSTEGNRIHRTMFYASAYAMDEMLFFNEKLRVSLGLRLTASNGQSNDYGAETETNDVVLTPRFGVNYMLDAQTALYFLHDQSYLPQSGISVNGDALRPLRGINYEAGLKRDWMDGRWNTTLAVYHIQRNRLITPDPVSNLMLQTGASVSRGVEFDMKGQLAKGLNVVVNYAYTDSKITEDELNPENIGLPTINRVNHIQNTWLNYLLPFKKLNGFTVSAGYQLLSGRSERIIYSHAEPMKDLFRLDVGAGWSNEKYRINLIVNNVLNDKLYSTAWRNTAGDMYYWVQLPPIHARLSLGVNL